MAISKSAKIEAEIEKVKAKISEQQARLKELEQKKVEAENSEIVDIVRGMSIPLAELPVGSSRSGPGPPWDKMSRSPRGCLNEKTACFDGNAVRCRVPVRLLRHGLRRGRPRMGVP